MSKAILDALGVPDEASALRTIAEFTNFLSGIKEATGAEKMGESVVRAQQHAAFARQVLDVVGKPQAEVVGTLLAWKSAHDALPAAQALCSELEAKVDATERADLVKEGIDQGKLSPGGLAFWSEVDEHGKAKRSAADLRAFLATAPRIIPTALKQPVIDGSTGPLSGKDYGDLTGSEKHALKLQVGEEAFNQIRNDYYQRTGKKPVN